MWWLAIPLFLGAALPAAAETLVAARTLRAQTILGPDDVVVAEGSLPGTATDPREVIGLETRVAIYQGRPIRPADLGAPAIVDRNQAVVLIYAAGALTITVVVVRRRRRDVAACTPARAASPVPVELSGVRARR